MAVREIDELLKELKVLRQQNRKLTGWKERFTSLVRTSPDSVTMTDLDGNITNLSHRTLELHGYTSEKQLCGKSAFELIAREDHEKAMTNLKRTLEEGYVRNKKYKMLRKDGSHFIGELNASVIKDAEGRPVSFIANVRDITERMKYEEALQKSEHFLAQIFESIQEGMLVLDTDLTVQRVNEMIKTWYPKRLPIEGKKCYEAFHDRREPCAVCPAVKCLKSGVMEKEVVPGFGISTRQWLELFSFPIKDEESGRVTGVVEFVRDITGRTLMEEKIRMSEERFHKLSDAAEEGIAIHDQGIIIDANKALARMFGYSIDQLIGMSASKLTTTESWKTIRKHIAEGYDQPYEGIGVRKDGSRFYCQLVGKPFQYNDKVLRVAAIRDITRLKETEEALRHSEEKLRNLLESASDGIFAMDMKGVYTEVNRKFMEMHGFQSKSEVLGTNGFTFVAPGDKKIAQECVKRTLKKGTLTRQEFKVKRSDGSEFPVEIRGSILRDTGGKPVGFIGISRDITKRKRIEEELRKYREDLETLIAERTSELEKANSDLRQEISERKKTENLLSRTIAQLKDQETDLEKKNIALREIIAQIEIEKERIKNDININVRAVVFPLLEIVRKGKAIPKMVKLIQYHLEKMTSQYGGIITQKSLMLTPREVEITNMVKGGLSSKDIANILNISYLTVEKHRKNIRRKLQISNERVNLTSYLREMSQ